MLNIVLLPSLVCPIVLRKYDLPKYLNTFKARNQMSVNKHNPIANDMAPVFSNQFLE